MRVLNEYQRDEKILQNLHLIKIVAREYRFLDRSKFEDLLQEGAVGLIKAVDKYDPTTETNFKTYATYHIRYSIQDFLRKESTLVHIPHNRLCNAYRLLRFIDSHIQKNNGTPPSQDEMRGFLLCDNNYLQDLLFIIDILNNELNKIEEIKIVRKSKIHNTVLVNKIIRFIEKLSLKEEKILKEKYLENKSFRSIGVEMGLSHEAARKIHNKAIKKLKESIQYLEE